MIGRDQDRVPVGELPAPDSRDRRVGLEQALRRELAERDDDLRPDRVNLPEQERLALRHFVRLRIAVARRPAFDDVGDVDIFTPEVDGFDDPVQELSGTADERLALDVLIRAGRFADEHQVRIRIPDTEHHLLSPERVQLATTAIRTQIHADRIQDPDCTRCTTCTRRTHRDRFDSWLVPLAPFRITSNPIDTELAEELEVGVELLVGHSQVRADAAAPARARSRSSTRSRMTDATRSLLCRGTSSSPCSPTMVTALVSASNPRSDRDTSLATIRSAFLRARFSRARLTTLSVSAAKPTSTGADAPRPFRIEPRSARMSLVRCSVSVIGASAFAIFPAAAWAGV